MGLTRKQRIMLGAVGLGAVAVIVDRAVLLPASASASEVSDAADVPAVATEPAEAATAPELHQRLDTRDIAVRLELTAERIGFDRGELKLSTFESFQAEQADAAEPVVPAQAATLPSFVLSGVLPTAQPGLAVINNATIAVGGHIPGTGWRLESVGKEHVVVTDGELTHLIKLPRRQ